jgi:hypothetical protein
MTKAPTPRPERPPTRSDLLDWLEQMDLVLSSMAGRWFDGIRAEVRAEILTQLYEPNLNMLIRARRRPRAR